MIRFDFDSQVNHDSRVNRDSQRIKIKANKNESSRFVRFKSESKFIRIKNKIIRSSESKIRESKRIDSIQALYSSSLELISWRPYSTARMSDPSKFCKNLLPISFLCKFPCLRIKGFVKFQLSVTFVSIGSWKSNLKRKSVFFSWFPCNDFLPADSTWQIVFTLCDKSKFSHQFHWTKFMTILVNLEEKIQ